jgi:uncharacterized SAM-binding protein YcdF (DUF218 family)
MGSRDIPCIEQYRRTTKPPKATKLGKFRGWLVGASLFLLPFGWLAYRELKSALTPPEAILVLGGSPEREDFAAHFAQQHPGLPIWVSGGSNPEYTDAVFSDAGIDLHRVHIDRAAVDTVTNFTTLVDGLRDRGIDSVYLITSDYHMRRSRLIGEIVFGSRGILLRPVTVPSQKTPEPLSKGLRDGVRAIVWVMTGYTGATLMHRWEER